MVFLDIHAIQAVPPANINRDENGSPKTAQYGGARRLRVSSQAWKRAARKAMEAASADIPESQRTKRLPEVLANELTKRDPELGPRAAEVADATVTALFGAKTPKKNGRSVTEYLLFLGAAQRDRVVDLLLEHKADVLDTVGDTKKFTDLLKRIKLRDEVSTGHPPAVALFGRMIATDPTLNVDAACQVAHAISTHAVDAQFDYYTAVDDTDEAADETGAGMIGTIEFNAATMYRYATVDLRSLIDNLDGDRGMATDVAVSFARAFLCSMPTGKRTTFANNTRPDFALLSVRTDQPVSLAGAFERPVVALDSDGEPVGHLARSVRALAQHHVLQDEQYGTAPEFHTANYPAWIAEDAGRPGGSGSGYLPPSQPLPEGLAATRAALARLVGAPDA
ncbi:type I-E CRISPR-associated protein Cas7/Cse4/CasC [Streptomonospora nanhaiensis]|uniref:CRISPR system Cascade subunit CasC n=1 Tax=Streptomonospora nanhaiensis TaxID=1323731 RepID=A0A853BPR9_9ACTN|nr:type I-E CRISPR-associated protein Cas7/Cse4/CasC [Streptomonospora nanhaiensis]MBV2365714.1 type I-E CRISPR-associated protein Cas7/Cse4/CasC [Streptomonospora nanhaiensis]NYI96511.1 CRISPR system Cascade subunit CasC [Streptomonospora nanhaiensis]